MYLGKRVEANIKSDDIAGTRSYYISWLITITKKMNIQLIKIVVKGLLSRKANCEQALPIKITKENYHEKVGANNNRTDRLNNDKIVVKKIIRR